MNLLSPWVWAIHIASVTEWTAAALLLWRFGRRAGRPDVARVALAMLPHWAAGACVLAWHFFDDAEAFRVIASTHEYLTFAGSVALCAAAAGLREWRRRFPKCTTVIFVAAVAALFALPVVRSWSPSGGVRGVMIQSAGLAYVGFIALLIVNRRWDAAAFSRLTIAGYASLLAFIAVSIALTVYVQRVYRVPSLTYVDWLHGVAESFLTLANLMTVAGMREGLAALGPRLKLLRH
jgi:hypothetical protein